MNRIKELRQEKGLTLDKLAAKTGINRGSLNNYENEKTEPKLNGWIKIAEALGVSAVYLMGLEDSGSKYREERTAKLEETDLSIFYIDGSGPLIYHR